MLKPVTAYQWRTRKIFMYSLTVNVKLVTTSQHFMLIAFIIV